MASLEQKYTGEIARSFEGGVAKSVPWKTGQMVKMHVVDSLHWAATFHNGAEERLAQIKADRQAAALEYENNPRVMQAVDKIKAVSQRQAEEWVLITDSDLPEELRGHQ